MSQYIKRTYVIPILILCLVAWIGACIWVWGHRDDSKEINYGVVTTHQSAPYQLSAPANFRSMNNMSTSIGSNYTYSSKGIGSSYSYNMGGSSYSYNLHSSSSARMHSYGGGGSFGGGYSSSAHRNSSTSGGGAVSMISVSIPSAPSYSGISQASETVKNGQTADETAVAMGIASRAPQTQEFSFTTTDQEANRAPGYDPEDPWKTPVGDTPWIIVGLLGIAYIVAKQTRKETAKEG